MNTATTPPTDGPKHAPTDHEMDHEMEHAAAARLKMGLGQKAVVALLLTVVLVPPLAGFYSYFSGIPLHLLAAKKERKTTRRQPSPSHRASRWSRARPTRWRSPTRSPPPWESARASRTRSRSHSRRP